MALRFSRSQTQNPNCAQPGMAVLPRDETRATAAMTGGVTLVVLPTPLPCFLEVFILRDFKSFAPEVLILGDFKSLFPEVFILVDFKSILMSEMEKSEKILEVLILEELGRTNCKNG
jgi:hypothetical protein